MVGLGEYGDHFPSQLSGGQQQRVSIARALAKKPRLLLCDEPTGALDRENGVKILELLQELHATQKSTVIMITHSAAIAEMGHRCLFLEDGVIRSVALRENPLPPPGASLVRVLTRKLFRDIFRSRGMLLAIILIITAGNTCFVALLSSYFNLLGARESYYAAYAMGDFWVELKKCPSSEMDRILKDFPDILTARQRLVFPARVEIPGSTEPVSGMVLSLPPDQESPVNDILLRRGSSFTYELRNQVICSEKFARSRGINPGDTLTLITGGVRKELVVTGTADSPEFVYLASPGSLMEDTKNYGVFYIKQDFAEDLYNFEGACNNLVGILSPEGKKNTPALLRELSERLTPYGVYAAYPRKEQFSALLLDSEIQGLRSMSVVLPLVFLGISALILNVLMTRMAEQQRITAGTLKALGYSNAGLLPHYLGFGIFPGVIGGLLDLFWVFSLPRDSP